MKRFLSLLLVLTLLLPCLAFAETSSTISVRDPNEPQGTVSKVSTRRVSFRCTYKNYNPYKTVKSFDVAIFTADAYDDQNCPLTYVNVPVRLKPYETDWTGEIFLENANYVYYIYTAVQCVYFTDGTVEQVDPDDLEYFCWDNSEASWLK